VLHIFAGVQRGSASAAKPRHAWHRTAGADMFAGTLSKIFTDRQTRLRNKLNSSAKTSAAGCRENLQLEKIHARIEHGRD